MSDLPLSLLSAAPTGSVELVADGEHLRRVVYGGMLKAGVSVDLMTADFKAMLVPDPGIDLSPSRGRDAPSIVDRLARMAQRGVEVRVLHAGVPSGPALQQLKRIKKQLDKTGRGAGGVTIRRCPRLHAKAVIIDAERLYLGSANLTGAGLGAKADQNRNHELGVWTTSPDLVDAVSQYFNRLWEGEPCDGCGRKDVCPEPLEEPRL
jgi:phosphatidylserine/phosphatidylglycerophosphate/cardiolipin synthase-like enzyme